VRGLYFELSRSVYGECGGGYYYGAGDRRWIGTNDGCGRGCRQFTGVHSDHRREHGGRDYVYDGHGDGGEYDAGDDYVQRDAGSGSAGMQGDAEECGNGIGCDDGVHDGSVDYGVDDCDWGDGVVGCDGL
jgi:hypothetical protein